MDSSILTHGQVQVAWHTARARMLSGGENLGKSGGGRGKGGLPSKNPGKPSGRGRDNNPPKGE
jgi:hypothetical protein